MQVLRIFAGRSVNNVEIKLVTPSPIHTYSGMVPGVVAGHYAVADAQIDVAALARRARVDLILDRAVSFDSKQVRLEKNEPLAFDLLSLNLGSIPDYVGVPGAREHAIGAKPFETFLGRWNELRLKRPHIAVAGAGAAGVELAMAMKYAGAGEVSLYSDRNVLPQSVLVRILRALKGFSIDFRADTPVTAVEPGPTVISRGGREKFDALFWAAGAAAPPLLRESGLRTDKAGFALTDSSLRSVSHPAVFAAGDTATLEAAAHPKSGVYAVRHGAVLAENLRRVARGEPLNQYRPQDQQLALISCGAKYAIASRGGWSAEGAWAWRWKDWIDRRWIARFR